VRTLEPGSQRVLAAGAAGVATAAGAAAGMSPQALLLAVVGFLALAMAVAWFRLTVRGDAGSVVVLLAVFVLNRPVAALLGEEHPATASLGLCDDLLLALGVVVLAISRRPSTVQVPRIFWWGFLAYGICGVASAVVQGAELSVIAEGTWLALKLPIAIWYATRLTWSCRAYRWLWFTVGGLLAVTAVVSLVEAFLPELVHTYFGFQGIENRFGLTALKGVFEHPAQASTYLLFVVCLLLGTGSLRGTRALMLGCASVLALLTLRLKAFVDLAGVGALALATTRGRAVRLVSPFIVLALAAVMFAVGEGTIRGRYETVLGPEASSPRSSLYATSGEIVADEMPLGVGFGRFGSETSTEPYSEIYFEYALSDVYGFRPDNPVYATDASWATAFGEAGLLGGVAVFAGLGALWLTLWRRSRFGAEYRIRSSLLFLTVILLDSLASPRLFDGLAAIGLGVLLSLQAFPAAAPTRKPHQANGIVEAPAMVRGQ
jgi:hypothetical protein